jgi:hypothetical protein
VRKRSSLKAQADSVSSEADHDSRFVAWKVWRMICGNVE